jgi:hypothetical protein
LNVFQTNGRSGGKSAPPSTSTMTTTSMDDFTPLSKAKLTHPKSEYDFHTTLLNGKLAELEKEIAHFKSENEKLVAGRRKLQADRVIKKLFIILNLNKTEKAHRSLRC